MAVFTITQATLISNVAYYEVKAGHEWQVGETVTTANCTTSTFNISNAVILSSGPALIPTTGASSGAGTGNLWNGFAVSVTHANIANEIEPATATVTDSN